MKNIRSAVGFAVVLSARLVIGVETPTMGWSSWNTYHVNISDALIRRQAEAMVATGLADCGYRYVNIDDGWFGGRDQQGRHTFNAQRFPKGLKPVVNYIHSLGLKAGAYSDAGENTCGSIWDNDVLGVGVGFFGHDDEDAKFFFKDNDFDFIKIDFCGGVGGEMGPFNRKGNSAATNMNERVRYTAIRQAIDRVGRPDVRVNICRWAYPGTWVGEVGSSWRVTADIQANWPSVRDIILECLFLAPYAGGGSYNDMDMLEIGRGLTEEEERTHFAVWCILSSPLLIGCDLTQIPASSLALLKNRDLIALNQDPLGLQAQVVALPTPRRIVFAKDLLEKGGLERAVALVNLGDDDYAFSLAVAELELAGKVEARELVTGTKAETLGEQLCLTVPAHGTRILRLKGERRLERTSYPAHWAWLSQYQETDMGWRSPSYSYCEDCGRISVVDVGGSRENFMEWRGVRSAEGGAYELEFETGTGLPWGFDVVVNGRDFGRCSSASDWKLVVELARGENVIRLKNDHDRLRPMKAMKLRRLPRASAMLSAWKGEGKAEVTAFFADEANLTALLAPVGAGKEVSPTVRAKLKAVSERVCCRDCPQAPRNRWRWSAALLAAAKESPWSERTVVLLAELAKCVHAEELSEVKALGDSSNDEAVKAAVRQILSLKL